MGARRSSAFLVPLLAACACRPVIAVGWGELVLLVVVIALLLGPLLFRLYRYLSRLQDIERSRDKRDQ
jgi:Flp pilus assembly protein TadB